MDSKLLEEKLENGDCVECASCGEISAYSFDDADPQNGDPDGSFTRMGWEPGEIAKVGAADCFSWECGHCGAHNADPDSVYMSECYTHVDPSDLHCAE